MEEVDEDDIEGMFGVVQPKFLRDSERFEKSIADMDWDRRGWTGRSWPGRYIGCPLSPDGSEMKHQVCNITWDMEKKYG